MPFKIWFYLRCFIKFHHITNGNDMKFNKSSEIRPDFEWQKKLSQRDRLFFERKYGKLNRELGYE